MKKLLVLSAALFSLVFAEFGGYLPLDINNPTPRFGAIWSLENRFKLPIDVQAEYWNYSTKVEYEQTGYDEKHTTANSGIALQGTYYFFNNAKENLKLGATARWESETVKTKIDPSVGTGIEDELSGSVLKLGGSARWKLNNLFSIKADVFVFSTSRAKGDHDAPGRGNDYDIKAEAGSLGLEGVLSFAIDLF